MNLEDSFPVQPSQGDCIYLVWALAIPTKRASSPVGGKGEGAITLTIIESGYDW